MHNYRLAVHGLDFVISSAGLPLVKYAHGLQFRTGGPGFLRTPDSMSSAVTDDGFDDPVGTPC